AEDGIRDFHVTGVQTCALPILARAASSAAREVEPEVMAARLAAHDAADVEAYQRLLAADEASADAAAPAPAQPAARLYPFFLAQIGRASCRDRGKIPGAAGALH